MKLEIFVNVKNSETVKIILGELLNHCLQVLKLLGLEATGAFFEDKEK